MTVVVYPQLGEILRARRLTVADLERQLRQRFGLTVNTKTLYRLTKTEPIQRADLEVALATAAILEIALDDLFTMQTLPNDGDAAVPVLDPAASRRLAELFDRQATHTLTTAERGEIDRLILDYSRLARDRELRRHADEHGLTFEQARDRVREQVGDTVERERTAYPAAAPPPVR
jgi:hypothetical protein